MIASKDTVNLVMLTSVLAIGLVAGLAIISTKPVEPATSCLPTHTKLQDRLPRTLAPVPFDAPVLKPVQEEVR